MFSLLTDNSFIFEGKKFEKNCLRVNIWNDVDKDRSMVIDSCLDKDFGFREYSEYILNAPAILIEDEKGTAFIQRIRK